MKKKKNERNKEELQTPRLQNEIATRQLQKLKGQGTIHEEKSQIAGEGSYHYIPS
jgi:hypothetical protein